MHHARGVAVCQIGEKKLKNNLIICVLLKGRDAGWLQKQHRFFFGFEPKRSDEPINTTS